MPVNQMRVFLSALLLSGSAALAAQGAGSAGVITSTSSRAMIAVARALTEDAWNPILDQRIQEAPAAARLGGSWTPSDPRWKKARAALGARMTRVLDAYGTGQIDGFVQAEVGRIGAGAPLDAAVAALKGPAGAVVVREQARSAFIVSTMTAGPDGPKPGTPEWTARLRELGARFDERVGPALPPEDASHRAEAEKLAPTPAWSTLSRVWTFAIANATRQLKTALNLMLVDDQSAIDRDIASAIGARAGETDQQAAKLKSLIDVERLASCKDSWLDWKDDPALARAYAEYFLTNYRHKDNDAGWVPQSKVTAAGFPVTTVYPESVGMGVGFSIIVDAPFDRVKKAFEGIVGRPVAHCETGDGMHTCDVELGEKKTFTLLADSTGTVKTTLVGCFYFYEK